MHVVDLDLFHPRRDPLARVADVRVLTMACDPDHLPILADRKALATEVQRMSFAAPVPADVADLGAARRSKLRELLESDPALWTYVAMLRAPADT